MVKTNSTKKAAKCAKLGKKGHLLWIVPLCVIVGGGALVGIIFFGIYLGTLGTVSNSGFCMSNSSCIAKTNLICVNSYCSCPTSYTWNSTNSTCVYSNTTSTNSSSSTVSPSASSSAPSSSSTTSLTAIQKILQFFYYGNFTINTISNYSGTTFSSPTDIKFYETPSSISIYIADTGRSIIALFNETGSFIKAATGISAYYIQPMSTGNVYVSRVPNNNWINIYDLNLNSITASSYSTTHVWNSYAIRYNQWTGYLYHCDINGGYVNAFDMSLNRLGESFYPWGSWSVTPTSIGFYQAVTGNILIVGGTQNRILIIQQSTKALITSFSSICATNYMLDIYCDPSGYFYVACYWDKRIQLWFTNGTNTYRTGQYLPTAGNPYSVHTDSKGRLATALVSPSRFDIYTPLTYS